MARFGWFIAGAAAATGALVSAPSAYRRLREALPGGAPKQLPAGDWPKRDTEQPAAATTPPAEDATAAAPPAANGQAPAEPPADDEETRELRERIEATRARIQRRANEVSASEFDTAS